MRFKVPQNIDIEDRIFGNFSLRQVVYIAGSLGISYILWVKLPAFLGLPLILGIVGFAWALAFVGREKYGRPFSEVTEAAFKYLSRARLYTWKRIPKKQVATEETVSGIRDPLLSIPKIQAGKLSNKVQEIEVKGGNTEEESANTPAEGDSPIFR